MGGQTEGLCEHDDRGPDRYVLELENRLRGQDRLLHPNADAEPAQYLEWQRSRLRGVDHQRGQHPRAENSEDRRDDHNRGVVSDLRDDAARENRPDNERDDHW